MEQQRYLEQHHHAAGVHVESYQQASPFCVPQIKMEPDPESYNCLVSHYSSGQCDLVSQNSINHYKGNLSSAQSSFSSSGHHSHFLNGTMSHISSVYSNMDRLVHHHSSISSSNTCLQENPSPTPHHHSVNSSCSRVNQEARTHMTQIDSGPKAIPEHNDTTESSSQHSHLSIPGVDVLHEKISDQCFQPTEYSGHQPNQSLGHKECAVQDIKSECDEEELDASSKVPNEEHERISLGTSSDEDISNSSSSQTVPPRSASKPQACKVCGKVLSSASSYYVHMKLHSGSKPYACSMCEAAFCRKPYLEVHMRTHTGERPFQCEMCSKRFTQKSSLNTHKRVHTGERPYSCDICQKKFAVKSYVTAHRWSHVSEKPLGCQRCGLTFTSKNLFALHVRTHVDQSHECHICGRTFMKDSYLIRHQNRVHRDRGHLPSDSSEIRSDVDSPSPSPPPTTSSQDVKSSCSSPGGSPAGSLLGMKTC